MIAAIKRGVGRLFNSGVTSPEQWLVDYVNGGQESSTGQHVSFRSAIGLPSVWSATNIISGHMAQMPVQIRRKKAGRWT